MTKGHNLTFVLLQSCLKLASECYKIPLCLDVQYNIIFFMEIFEARLGVLVVWESSYFFFSCQQLKHYFICFVTTSSEVLELKG